MKISAKMCAFFRTPIWSLLTLAVVVTTLPAAGAQVRAWEEEVKIPTYPIGPEDSYPVFRAFGGRNIYPYAMQTDLGRQKKDVAYRVLMLENEHLRVMVLPELGGRLYSLYDKDAEREVFYRNHVIKPGLVGQRGAWISGGIEFNFPTGHTVTGFSAVLGRVRENEDGSASIVVGDVEKVSRMAWSVTLTLSPGSAALQQDVDLANRTDIPHRYYFWSNSAFPAREQTRFISPGRYQTDHSGGYVYDWPVDDGIDISWDRNNPDAQSYFGYDVPEDFFGAYDHAADAGLVHVADFRQVPGKKFWTWGNGGSSDRWVEILTDEDGQYVEVQSGRFWNQSTWKLLLPQQTVHWREWWYGVHGTDGFRYATEAGAMNWSAAEDGLRVAVRPVRAHRKGRLVAERDGRMLADAKLTLRPDRPDVVNLPVADTTGLVLRVLSEGELLWVWDPAARIEQPEVRTGEQERDRSPDPDDLSPDAVLRLARTRLQAANAASAEIAIRSGLARDPGHTGLLTMLGRIELDRGQVDRAAEHFAAALQRDPGNPAALHGAAAAALAAGDPTTAEARLRGIVDDPTYGTAARLLTGRALMLSGHPLAAADVFAATAARAPQVDKAAAYHAAALRASGRPQQALAAATAGLKKNPISNLLRAERWLSLQQLGRDTESPSWPADPDVLLEVVVDERAIGDWAAARVLLQDALPASDRLTDLIDAAALSAAHPIAVYYLADTEAHLGHADAAASLYRAASGLPTRDVFPFRVETLAVLDAALVFDATDAAAHYYRGSILAHHRRLDEASVAWEQSVALDGGNAVAWRNVALGRDRNDDDEGAIGAFQQAIHAAPQDVRLYTDLEELYQQTGVDLDTRLTNITAGLARGSDDELATAAAGLLNEAGRYGEAIALLSGQIFDVWEGGYAIHGAWEEAHVGAGQEALTAGDPATALAHFEQAMEYPANLGVGRPSQERLAWPKYWAARAHEALGHHDQARALYRQAADESYRRASPNQYFQALAFRALGEEEGATRILQDMLTAAQRRSRRSNSAYRALLEGLAYHGLGDTARAVERLRSFLDDPDARGGWVGRNTRRYRSTVEELTQP